MFPDIRVESTDCAKPVMARLTLTDRPEGYPIQPKASLINVPERTPELSAQSCLETLRIFLLSEWDVLAFVYRHGAILTSADRLARLIAYEGKVVGDALDRLGCEKLVERSRRSQGVRLYRIPASMDAERWRCLQQLVSLTASRAGRLLLANLLRPGRPETQEKNNRPTPEGESHV